MTAQYWVARYVPNPFRNEPRNVGVIVRKGDLVVGMFVGERENGTLDGRKTAGFSNPAVYSQWHKYWKRKIAARAVDDIIDATTPNYGVVYGGDVTDIGEDNALTVCRFMYNLLVGGGIAEAYEWTEEKISVKLVEDIVLELDRTAILEKTGQLFARHPVQRNASVFGKSVTHTPSFSQRNGKLTVMEYIDLGVNQINKAKERAGWMAYMFRDIKDREPTSDAISLVRPEGDAHSEQIAYARQALAGGSKIVNWFDDNERGSFLEERKRIAEPGLSAG